MYFRRSPPDIFGIFLEQVAASFQNESCVMSEHFCARLEVS